MSEDVGPEAQGGLAGLLEKLNPTVLVAIAAGAVLVALFAMVSLVLLLTLSSDVSRLEDQIRKSNKVLKLLEQEVGQLRKAIVVPPGGDGQAPASTAVTPPKPGNIDAVDTQRDCVVRPGDKTGIAGCLRQ